MSETKAPSRVQIPPPALDTLKTFWDEITELRDVS